jgi:hypothetical protein
MSDLPGASIPLDRAGLCLDCLVVFDLGDGQCPKCGTTVGIASVRVSGSKVLETVAQTERATP